MSINPIGVFDSGLGGLTTLAECRKLLPEEDFIYLADSNNLPYGEKTDAQIKERVFACVSLLLARKAKAVVVACNTATNAGIKDLRNLYRCPFVGLEPAIKPANEQAGGGNILLLCTCATANGQKLAALKEKLGAQNVIVSPQKNLAKIVENALYEHTRNPAQIFELYEKNVLPPLDKIRFEVEKIFSIHNDFCAVVLGCTHYVFIKDMIQHIAGNNIKIYDGNHGAAMRLKSLLESNELLNSERRNGIVTFLPPPKFK